MATDEMRAVAELVTELVLQLASAHQEEIHKDCREDHRYGIPPSVFDTEKVANMTFTLRDIVTLLGKRLKCKGYAEDVMAMVLSYAKSLDDAGGAVNPGKLDQTIGNMVAELAHNGIRFHHEPKPKQSDPIPQCVVDHWQEAREARMDGHNA